MIIRRLPTLFFTTLLIWGCGGDRSPKNAAEECDRLLAEAHRNAQIQEYETAAQYALQAQELALKQDGLEAKAAEALCELATIDLMTWRDSQAWEHAGQAEKMARGLGREDILTKALIGKGKVCLFSGITAEEARDDEALTYFEEALAIAERIGDVQTRVDILCDIAQVYINKNRFNNPIDPELYKAAGEYLSRGESLGQRGKLPRLDEKIFPIQIRYLRQGGRIQEAIDCCNHMLSITSEKEYLQQEQSYYQLVMLHASQGDAKKAAEYHQQYVYANEHYMKQKADNLIQEMETRFEAQEKERKLEQRRIQIILLLVAVLLLLGMILTAILKNRQIRRQNDALAQANDSKDKLLTFISRDLTNPDFSQNVQQAVKGFGAMSEEELQQRCTQLMEGSDNLGQEVAGYMQRLIQERKKAGAKIGLTARELEIIRLSSDGLSPAEIAEKLHISIHTVNNHKQNIYAKMEVKSNAEMIRAASSLGLV